MRAITDVATASLRGKRVIVRGGFDVPLEKGEVADMFRIERGLATLEFLRAAGAKTVIISHIGRDPEESNAPVYRALSRHLPLSFVPDIVGPAARDAVQAMREGDIVLLENLRQDARETKNDEGFARELARHGDIYVNDAFSAAHRAHTSIAALPQLCTERYAGVLLAEEVRKLSAARDPEHPSVAILGGAKFETKAPLIKLLLGSYDGLFIAGALANDVFHARGFPVGRSLVSEIQPGGEVLEHPHFIAPVDVTAQQLDGHATVKLPQDVQPDDKIVDIGPDSVAALAPHLENARFILWNGPTGLYEEGFTAHTQAIAEIISRRVAAGAQCIIGGGDTIAAIDGAGLSHEQLGFVSTGGGAMLEYLLEGTLPGIAALN
jgi:phosphoglycerate kinase